MQPNASDRYLGISGCVPDRRTDLRGNHGVRQITNIHGDRLRLDRGPRPHPDLAAVGPRRWQLVRRRPRPDDAAKKDVLADQLRLELGTEQVKQFGVAIYSPEPQCGKTRLSTGSG